MEAKIKVLYKIQRRVPLLELSVFGWTVFLQPPGGCFLFCAAGALASLLEGSEANWINACRGQAHLLWSEGVSLDRSDAVRILPQRG